MKRFFVLCVLLGVPACAKDGVFLECEPPTLEPVKLETDMNKEMPAVDPELVEMINQASKSVQKWNL